MPDGTSKMTSYFLLQKKDINIALDCYMSTIFDRSPTRRCPEGELCYFSLFPRSLALSLSVCLSCCLSQLLSNWIFTSCRPSQCRLPVFCVTVHCARSKFSFLLVCILYFVHFICTVKQILEEIKFAFSAESQLRQSRVAQPAN